MEKAELVTLFLEKANMFSETQGYMMNLKTFVDVVCELLQYQIVDVDILEKLKIGLKFKSKFDNEIFEVISIDSDSVKIKTISLNGQAVIEEVGNDFVAKFFNNGYFYFLNNQ